MDDSKLIRCTTIGVDCIPNDPINISYGDPEYLGFDFDVAKDQVDDMMGFVEDVLDNYDVPFVKIYSYGNISLNESRIWSKDRIAATIAKEADFLREENLKKHVK